MSTDKEIKNMVKEKYGEIAKQAPSSCCCGGKKEIIGLNVIGNEYKNVAGHNKDADLNLGCGIPTEYANMKAGDTVLDLGSGAGNDVFIASTIVGETGRVTGVDMTEEMIARANHNKEKWNYTNVEFRFGEIEALPVDDNSIDVVISNCVLNLVPNKHKAFAEIYRVLKPGAHFCISDIVLKGELPAGLRNSAAMYAGCIASAMQQDEYLGIITETGFRSLEVLTTKTIELPDELLAQYLSSEEIAAFKNGKTGIFSITARGVK